MARLHGFQKKELLEIYYKMFLARTLDEKQLILLKQGKGFFHIGASGHEAASAEDVSVADANGDGWPDIVVACELAHLIYFQNLFVK